MSLRCLLQQPEPQGSRINLNFFAGGKLAATLGKDFPCPIRKFAQKKPFPTSAGACPQPHQTSRHDARVVEHEQIAGIQQLRQILKNSMLNGLRGPANDEQARLVALGTGFLGDEIGRKVVVEKISSHGASLRQSAVGERNRTSQLPQNSRRLF